MWDRAPTRASSVRRSWPWRTCSASCTVSSRMRRPILCSSRPALRGGVCRSRNYSQGRPTHSAWSSACGATMAMLTSRPTAQGRTKDLDTQHRRHDDLGDAPYEPCPEHTLQYWGSREGSRRQPYIPQREDHTTTEKACEQARSTGVSRDGRYVHGLTRYHGCHTIYHDRLQQRS